MKRMLKITLKNNISCCIKFFQNFFTWQNVENVNNLAFTYLANVIALNVRYSFSLKLILFCCSSTRLVYFRSFLALRFFSLREIHRNNPSLHALCVWPIFLCARNEENDTPFYPLSFFSPFFFLSLSFARATGIPSAFFRFTLQSVFFLDMHQQTDLYRLIRERVNWYRRW